MNILILSHGHPTLSAGGAERAAYSLFEHLKSAPEINRVIFASRASSEHVGHSATMGLFRGRADEPIISVPPADWPSLMSLDYDELRKTVEELIAWARPDIVHVHHYSFWSLDLFEILYSLGVKIVFTMHEYIAICQNFGQMIKTDGRLCDTASPVECSSCFPESTPGMFFLRDRIFKSYLSYCDYFISPSQFLLDRYIAWGLDPAAAEVIENPIAPSFLEGVGKVQSGSTVTPTSTRLSKKTTAVANVRRKRLGYFGQVNPFKGLKVLLRALSSLPAEIRNQVEIGIHGANLEKQEQAFQSDITALLDQHKDVVTFFGPYSNEYVLALMSTYDWIVVPSTWWENSPVVIQEALLVGKPVLCSRIGGMAEKVRPGIDGIHFEAGNSADLAQKLSDIVRDATGIALNTQGHRREHALAAERHVALYRRVLASQAQLCNMS